MTNLPALEPLESRLLLDAGPVVGDAQRVVSFAGLQWYVQAGEGLGDPANVFSDDAQSVWVDQEGMHLKIRQDGASWWCAEVYTVHPTASGMHRFSLDARVDLLDKNVVAALSLANDSGEEFGVQFSDWSQADPQFNTQFFVRSDQAVNLDEYNTTLNGSESTSYFDWDGDSIQFKSFHGHSAEPETAGHLIRDWTHTGPDVPGAEAGLTIRASLWLNYALPPSDQQEVEIVIRALDVPNLTPTISTLAADRQWLMQEEALTLTAYGVGDPDGEAVKVEFYRDANDDGVIEPAEKIGEDIDGGDGWSWTGPANWEPGSHTFYARATDDDGAVSSWAGAAVAVQRSPDISVVIGTGEAAQGRAVVFTDVDGTRATVRLNRGTATLRFMQNPLGYSADGRGVMIHVAGVTLTEIVLDDVSINSNLQITAAGGADGRIGVGRVTGSTPLGRFIAPKVDVSGSGIHMTGRGAIQTLRLHDLLNGADIDLEGDLGRRAMSMKLHAVSEGSVIDILQGPVRNVRFAGAFRGVLAAGVDAGADGRWFTDDDAVVNPFRVGSVSLARKVAGNASTGTPRGLLLGPGAKRVATGLGDRANEGASVDGAGFEAWVLPGTACGIAIQDPVRGKAPRRWVSGKVSDVALGFYKVVLYTKTDHWRVHRFGGQAGKVLRQARWRVSRVEAGDVYAYLVRRGYQPPELLHDALNVDGRDIVALDVWQG